MKKIILGIVIIFSSFLNANTFNIDESNSQNKFSLLKITPIKNYFRFNIDVMQKNDWSFRTDIFLKSDNLIKKVKADFNGNSISFTLTEEEYLDLLTSEFLFVNTHLKYEDSFYMPLFRNSDSYKKLAVEEFKEDYLK
jgi:hypothetical protein